MSTQSDQFREMAAKARSEAKAAELPNVQQVHLRSAEKLDQLAQNMEGVAHAKARNEAGKAAELQDTGSSPPDYRETSEQ